MEINTNKNWTSVIRQTPSSNLDPNSRQLLVRVSPNFNFPRQEGIARGPTAHQTTCRDTTVGGSADKPPLREHGTATGKPRYCQAFQRWTVIKEIGSNSLGNNELQLNTPALPLHLSSSSWISAFRFITVKTEGEKGGVDKLRLAAQLKSNQSVSRLLQRKLKSIGSIYIFWRTMIPLWFLRSKNCTRSGSGF